MLTLADEMRRVKVLVDRTILEELLPRSSNIAEIDLLYQMMRDYPSRPAKGLRPFLCNVTCRAAGGREEDSLITAACIELFQHWILIHDDIEDQSELRRGQPTLHRKYNLALALNTGDALHAKMWGSLLLNEKQLGTAKTIGLLGEFSRMVGTTTEGQHMELGWVTNHRWDLGETDYIEMCTRKTSWYTVAGPCRLGAMVAGADAGVLDKLAQFGAKLGVAFQIQDDTLNLVGDQERYGKATSDDLLEGKRTLILLTTIQRASPGERSRIVSILNKERRLKTKSEIEYVVSLIEKYEAIEYSRKCARTLMEQAVDTLRSIEWKGDEDAANLLASFSKFAVDRQW